MYLKHRYYRLKVIKDSTTPKHKFLSYNYTLGLKVIKDSTTPKQLILFQLGNVCLKVIKDSTTPKREMPEEVLP